MTKIPSYSEAKQVDLSAMPWGAWTEFKGETFLYVRKDNDTFLPLNDIVPSWWNDTFECKKKHASSEHQSITWPHNQ